MTIRISKGEKMNNKLKVAIAGNIGVGKSTLCDNLSNEEGVKIYKEEIDRELLDMFTKQVITKEITSDKPIELLHQLRFLNNTIIRDIKSEYYDSKIDVYDRAIFEHIHVFAKNTLKHRDWALFNGMQEILLANLGWQKYDLTIILNDTTENIYKKVSKRGRNEEELTEEYKVYLKQLNDVYNSGEFVNLAKEYSDNIEIIDVRNYSPTTVKLIVADTIEKYVDKLK